MFDKKRRAGVVAGRVLAAILLLLTFRPFASGQTTDPFYHKWLESGEASYFARNFDEAVKSLEIAVFGLIKEKDMRARGYVFLALCRASLGQNDSAATALTSAADCVGWDGLRGMNLRFEARKELDKLLTKHSPTVPAEPAKPAAENK
ncbi:MAG: hypothetical protein ACYDH3_08335, partial [Candidatus Aminicenantales bacterium]